MRVYTREMHTGSNVWDLVDRRWTPFTVVPCYWITCNGERVDVRGAGAFPKPYILGAFAYEFVEIMRSRESRVAGLSRFGL